MKKGIFLLILVASLASCSTVKQSQKAVNQGNYELAINTAIKALQKNKHNKRAQQLVPILEDAFNKNTARVHNRLAFLEKDNNPANKREIFNLYTGLDRLQNAIKPLLPLQNSQTGKEAHFNFINYTPQLLGAKENYAEFLYQQAVALMRNNQIMDYRAAHRNLVELSRLYSDYKDANTLKQQAHFRGTDFVLVTLLKNSNTIIPTRLEYELLDFNTYGLDDFWTEFHQEEQQNINYNFEVVLEFVSIQISPERILQKEEVLEREIIDGYTYQIDRNGNYVLDEDGNRIRINRYVNARGTLYKTVQSKAIQVVGIVSYYDIHSQRRINSYPLETEFIFENMFASFRGNNKVLNSHELQLIRNRYVPFPPNEQMLFDASTDIKQRLGSILRRNKFR